jgi:hypothetical protein
MVCLHLHAYEKKEDRGSYYWVYMYCPDCGAIFDQHTEDK